MSTSATPKSVLIGNTANMKPTYSAKVTCEKEKEFSTKQTCHDEPNMSRQFKVKRWVTADFVNVSRRVSVKCNSTYTDANLHYSIDSASLNNSEELHIRNFQLQTCVRKRQSFKCLYLICRFQNGGYRKLAYFRNVLLYKYKRSQRN